MLSLKFNPEDDAELLKLKQQCLKESGNSSMDSRLSCGHMDACSREGFSYLRLISAT